MASDYTRTTGAARNARARAAGYTSASQQYRAEKKAGFKGGGQAYNAALRVRKTSALQQTSARGRLLGLQQTRAGRVVAAQFTRQASAQWAAIRGLSNSYHATITIDGYLGGRALTLGGHGGYSLAFLHGMVTAAGTWAQAVANLAHDQYPAIEEPGDLDGTTVTVVIA